jgi:hypothetical protein
MFSNKVDDYTISSSSEDANYPDDNVQHNSLIKAWHSTSVEGEYLELDMGAGVEGTADTAILAGHNLTSGGTIILRAIASGGSWGSPALSANMTLQTGIILDYISAGHNYRYWRFYLDDSANADGYISVGRLFIGEYLQADPSSYEGFPIKHVRTDSGSFSISNQYYSDEGVGYRELKYAFPRTANTAKTAIETMWNTVGKHKPLFFANFDSSYWSVIDPIYCTIIEDITFTKLRGNDWEYSLTLREVN